MLPTDQGTLAVIDVRATGLADELRTAINLARISKLFAPPRMHDPFYAGGNDLLRATERLLSTCEKALGTRTRHYDSKASR